MVLQAELDTKRKEATALRAELNAQIIEKERQSEHQEQRTLVQLQSTLLARAAEVRKLNSLLRDCEPGATAAQNDQIRIHVKTTLQHISEVSGQLPDLC